MSRARGLLLGLAVSGLMSGCGTLQQPQIQPGFASNPADKYGWSNPRLYIEGHAARPDRGIVRVTAKF